MKLILQSKQLLTSDTISDNKIHIISQFFIPNDSYRLKEIQYALKQNITNKYIHHIHLLNEKIYNSKELGIESDKIIQTNIHKRLTFQDVFTYVRNQNITGYIVMINSDICFNHSIKNLLRSYMSKNKQVCCLLRYEYNKQEPSKSNIFGPRYDSQDTWIIHSNQMIPPISEKIFSFEFGKPGCDNKLIYLFSILGYEIFNDPKTIQTYHIHSSKQRNYSIRNAVKLPVGVIIPYGFNIEDMKQKLGIDLRKYISWSNNFENISFDNNNMLRTYIINKFEQNQHFIIPRVSGIENNVAVFSRVIHQNLHNDIHSLRTYINKTLKSMKNNAGI